MANGKKSNQGFGAVEGILNGLTDIFDRLNEITAKNEHFTNTEIFSANRKEPIKGVYGFSIKMGIGGQSPSVEPFGNIRKDQASGKSSVHEVREPMVDIFEEKDHTLVLAEMPGIDTQDIHLEITSDLLILSAQCADKKYYKEILLPRTYVREQLTVSCNNGIVEIHCSNEKSSQK